MFHIGKIISSIVVVLALKSSTIPNSFMVSVLRIRSYYGLLFFSYLTTSGSEAYLLLSEYSKKFSSNLALRSVWKISFKVFHHCGTSLFKKQSSMGLSLLTKTRYPSDPLSKMACTSVRL